MVFVVFTTLCLVIFWKGLKNVHLDLPIEQAVMVSALVGLLAAVFGWILVGRAQPPPEDEEMLAEAQQAKGNTELARTLERALEALKSVEDVSQDEMDGSKAGEATSILEALANEVRSRVGRGKADGEHSYRFVERVFASLQVVSACCVAFAHGSNDVANAIGPLAAIVSISQTNAITQTVDVPLWTLIWGGVCIAAGIAMWGPRIMSTVGERITHLTPTRGFSAEFSAAVTVVLASRLGLPVSTTHVIVGAVIGVGIARGIASVDWRVMGRMTAMWVIEVPAVALISALLFLLLRAAF